MELFGKEKRSFELKKLKELVKSKDVKAIKEYVLSYFAKCESPCGIVKWNPSDISFDIFKLNEIGNLFFTNGLKFDYIKERDYNGKKKPEKKKFNLMNWFRNTEHVYRFSLNIHKPRVYEENGAYFINQFSGYMHDRMPYKDFENKTKESVNFILNHIKTIWANNNIEMYNYLVQWFAYASLGYTPESFLYIKSGQGTGKSMITEFIARNVIGKDLCIHTSNPKPLCGGFNKQLMGKTMIVLEEAVTESKGQWHSLSNSIKDKVTGSKLEIEAKNRDSIFVDNIMSLIVLSNNNAIKLESDDRRTVCLDISHEKVGKFEYFELLSEHMNGENVGKAFFNYMCEIKEKYTKFNARMVPDTNSKRDIVLENLHPIVRYIKEKYLEKNEGINIKSSEFCNKFNKHTGMKMDNTTVGRFISNLGIPRKQIGKDRNRTFIISYEDLYKLFDKKKYLSHEFEDYIIPNGCERKNVNVNVKSVEPIFITGEEVFEEAQEEKKDDNIIVSEETFNMIDDIIFKQASSPMTIKF